MTFEIAMRNGYGFNNASNGDLLFRMFSSNNSNGVHMGIVMLQDDEHYRPSALCAKREAILVSTPFSLATSPTPISSSTLGELGQILWDNSKLHVYVGHQIWKKTEFMTVSGPAEASAAGTPYVPAAAQRVGVLEEAPEDAHLFSNAAKDDLLLYGVHPDQAIVLGEKQNGGTVDVAARIGSASLELHRSLVLSASRYDPERRALGQTGELAWDENYLYICVSPGVWKRARLT